MYYTTDMTIEDLGYIIRERRNTLKMNQDSLSQRSSVAIKTIHSIEQGKANPSLKTLNLLLKELKLELFIRTETSN